MPQLYGDKGRRADCKSFKNLILEKQAALIYFNIGTGKLRATLSHVTYESDMQEIRFRRKRQNLCYAVVS